MSLKDAEKWNKNSKIKETQYHATDNMKQIKKEGFRLDAVVKNGRVNGDGVYMAAERDGAEYWGGKDIVDIKINVKNPLTYDDVNHGRGIPKKFRGQKMPQKYGPDGYESTWSWVEDLGDEYFPGMKKCEKVSGVLEEMGIDAIIDPRTGAGTVVFNPKNIVVIK